MTHLEEWEKEKKSKLQKKGKLKNQNPFYKSLESEKGIAVLERGRAGIKPQELNWLVNLFSRWNPKYLKNPIGCDELMWPKV